VLLAHWVVNVLASQKMDHRVVGEDQTKRDNECPAVKYCTREIAVRYSIYLHFFPCSAALPGSPVFTSPSYAWQDHLSEQLAAKDRSSEGAEYRSDSVPTCWEDDHRQKRRTDAGAGSLRVDIESATQQVLYPAKTSANNGLCKCSLLTYSVHIYRTDYQPEPESPDLSGCGQLSLDKDLQVHPAL
jgi:hypothetical protein